MGYLIDFCQSEKQKMWPQFDNLDPTGIKCASAINSINFRGMKHQIQRNESTQSQTYRNDIDRGMAFMETAPNHSAN